MPDEKGIERKWTIRKHHAKEEIAGPQTGWVEVMPVADHQKALGEAAGERDDQKAAADEYATELANIRALFDAQSEALNLVRDLKSRADDRKERLVHAEKRLEELREGIGKLDRYESEYIEPYGYESPTGRFLDRDDVLALLDPGEESSS